MHPGGRALLEDHIARHGWAWVRNEGASMAPTLAVGQRVRLRRGDAIQAGDVVMFLGRDDQYVLHRVALVVPQLGFFVHVGDATARPAIASINAVIGIAELPRHKPSLALRARAVLRVARAARNVARRAWRFRQLTRRNRTW